MPELRWSVPASRGSLSIHDIKRQKQKINCPLIRPQFLNYWALPRAGLCNSYSLVCSISGYLVLHASRPYYDK